MYNLSFKLALFGILSSSLPFLANCHWPSQKRTEFPSQRKSLLLPQFMIRRIGHGRGAQSVEIGQKLAPIEKGNAEQSAEGVKMAYKSNEISRPCYFSPVQCLLRSPGQHRSFETHIGAKSFKFLSPNGGGGGSSTAHGIGNFVRRLKTKQRNGRQIMRLKNVKQEQNELEMNRKNIGHEQMGETNDTFQRQLFRNLWRN